MRPASDPGGGSDNSLPPVNISPFLPRHFFIECFPALKFINCYFSILDATKSARSRVAAALLQ